MGCFHRCFPNVSTNENPHNNLQGQVCPSVPNRQALIIRVEVNKDYWSKITTFWGISFLTLKEGEHRKELLFPKENRYYHMTIFKWDYCNNALSIVLLVISRLIYDV